MNIIANEMIQVINDYAKKENFNPQRQILVYLTSGNKEILQTILNHTLYIQSNTMVESITIDKEKTGLTYKIKGQDIQVQIEKGELV